jgi:MraZ protein
MSPVFMGSHHPKLDDKGRVILPAKFRDELEGGIVITKGQDRCLVIWPRAEFEAYAERLRLNAQSNAKVRSYTRIFMSSAFDDTLDRQGRLTIPPILREFAELDKDLVVTGANTRIEIWNAATWDAYVAEHEADYVDLDIDSDLVLP